MSAPLPPVTEPLDRPSPWQSGAWTLALLADVLYGSQADEGRQP